MANVMLTIRELALSINRRFGGSVVPEWKLRRVVDDLERSNAMNVQRFGRYRMISEDQIDSVADELRRIGWLEASDSDYACGCVPARS